ncbi:MAG: methylmalonyl-CoA mutase family protein [Candidatus Syntropharchaeales archaeon]|nr:methylmalonyl-CoA mutase family protein [Candidatus Syntrophoarchaeum sp.]
MAVEITEVEMKDKEWEEKCLAKTIERFPERKERFITISNTEIKRLYTPKDIADMDYFRDIGYPGEYPYTRGVQPTMYRGKIFTMRMFAGFGTAEDTNERYKYLLEHGETGLSVAFHLPTLMGHDSDNPLSKGEVGKCGVAVESLEDMRILFDGIPLDQVTTSMTINAPASVLLAMYVANAENRGIPATKIGGTIQNDIFKEYIAQKTFIFPPRPSVRLITDIFDYCSCQGKVPRWNTISISGYHIREAGATAVQELAFTLADGMAYVVAGIEAGLDPDKFAPRLSFFFNSHNDFFEEIAKFRAARRIWARFMKDEIGCKDSRSWMLRFHTQTAGCSLTAQQPLINIVRTTTQGLAAVLGGTQSLHTNSFDEALALPSETAVRVALRTQQIIAYESGVTNTIDPLAGSYFVEEFTNRMEREANKYFDIIKDMGDGNILEGVIAGIENAFFQRELADAAYTYQKQLESHEQIMVGVNEFTTEDDTPVEILQITEEAERRQIARTQRLRAERDEKLWRESLDRLRNAAEGSENLMPYILEAVKAYATLGEIMDTFREVWGEFREPLVF